MDLVRDGLDKLVIDRTPARGSSRAIADRFPTCPEAFAAPTGSLVHEMLSVHASYG
jgi:hypothetical protein